MLHLKRGFNNSGDYQHCGILVEATSGGKEETPGTPIALLHRGPPVPFPAGQALGGQREKVDINIYCITCFQLKGQR